MYEQFSLADQLRMITVEHEHHAPALAAAAQMWTEARDWIEHQHEALTSYVGQLRGTWQDSAGALLEERVKLSASTLWSWSGPPRTVLTMVTPLRPGSISTSGVADRLKELVTAIGRTYTSVKTIHDGWSTLPLHFQVILEPQARRNAGQAMDALAALYGTTQRAIETAVGPVWDGPRDVLPSRGTQDPGSPTGGPSPSSPSSPEPATVPNPTEPTTPSTPAEPKPSTSDTASLADVAKAVSALSDAAQQLMGTGTSVPEPTTFDPSTLIGDPITADPGLALAGLEPASLGEAGGGTGGSAPQATTAPPTSGVPIAAAPPATAQAARVAKAVSGAPTMPPVYPPQSATTRSGGVRPGAAEHPTDNGRTRARKRDTTPGVALRGRTGRGHTGTAPVSRPRGDTGPQRLLDEELWQVHEEHHEPDHRAGRRGGAL
ncbi:hypothetical protein [Saccharothrix variisporea]|uniref:PPE family protein n=1 Tax=Saccharothrix variisporea TaxID=543527 RepID=A0A495XG25_9PSEU|nr:hypothetical protein [Saccharothrix variisporea]RKT72649.1 hypothetical protein DFJ66_5971 [Saccharothrix variisporea]